MTSRAREVNMDRLYIVVRADLAPGAQIAQSCHALRAFVEAYPELDRAWHAAGGNLVVLSVPEERDLAELYVWATGAEELAGAWFREEDFGDELTAIALEGRAKPLLRALPLALRSCPIAA